MSKDDYQKHLGKNITKTYKKSNRNRVNDINLGPFGNLGISIGIGIGISIGIAKVLFLPY